jgi:hypothetical protein
MMRGRCHLFFKVNSQGYNACITKCGDPVGRIDTKPNTRQELKGGASDNVLKIKMFLLFKIMKIRGHK